MEPDSVLAKRFVKWCLKFINLDLDKLPQWELYSLWFTIRIDVYGWGEEASDLLADKSLMQWDERRKEAKEIQDSMKKILDAILKDNVALPPPKSQRKIPGRPVTSEDIRKPPTLTPTGELELLSVKNEIGVYRKEGRLFKYPRNLKDKVLYDFVNALSVVGVEDIQKCHREDCDAYFLKATMKGKRYCSQKCAWVMASRKRWELEPELLKAKRRDYYQRIKGMVSMGPAGSRNSGEKLI